MTKTNFNTDQLVHQKEMMLCSLTDCYMMDDRFMHCCTDSRLLESVAYTLLIVAPVWINEEYGHKVDELAYRIQQICRDTIYSCKANNLSYGQYERILGLVDIATVGREPMVR